MLAMMGNTGYAGDRCWRPQGLWPRTLDAGGCLTRCGRACDRNVRVGGQRFSRRF